MEEEEANSEEGQDTEEQKQLYERRARDHIRSLTLFTDHKIQSCFYFDVNVLIHVVHSKEYTSPVIMLYFVICLVLYYCNAIVFGFFLIIQMFIQIDSTSKKDFLPFLQ